MPWVLIPSHGHLTCFVAEIHVSAVSQLEAPQLDAAGVWSGAPAAWAKGLCFFQRGEIYGGIYGDLC